MQGLPAIGHWHKIGTIQAELESIGVDWSGLKFDLRQAMMPPHISWILVEKQELRLDNQGLKRWSLAGLLLVLLVLSVL